MDEENYGDIYSKTEEIRWDQEVPRREFELLKFYKNLQEIHEILGVEFNVERKYVNFLVKKR